MKGQRMAVSQIGTGNWAKVVPPAAALLLAPVALTATSPAGVGALFAAIADPLAVIAGRSPGARQAGALTQSKQRRSTGHRPRTERVLPRLRYPAVGGIGPADYVPSDAIPFGEIGPQAATPIIPIAFEAPVGGGGVGSFTGGAFGGGGIGGGDGGDTTTPMNRSPPTEAVPEPATWAMLMIGMLRAGIGLRRRPAVLSAGCAAATSSNPARRSGKSPPRSARSSSAWGVVGARGTSSRRSGA